MISKKMQDAINAQINAEFWSAYLYLSMSNNFAAKGNPGFANWFEIQFKEEQDHAMIFGKHILARGGKVSLAPIKEVKTEWATPLEAFEETLKTGGDCLRLCSFIFTKRKTRRIIFSSKPANFNA